MFRLLTILFLLPLSLISQNNVKVVDLLADHKLEINGAGPLLLLTDEPRNRVVSANTLSSSISIIDCADNHSVTNIPVERRALQHLKAEAMTINSKTGEVYLIGDNCLIIANPDSGTALTIDSDVQFESVAVDYSSGNAFICGRESRKIGFFEYKKQKLVFNDWLEKEEMLINMNQTPPPPIRKLVSVPGLNQVIAFDGYEARMYVFDGRSGELVRSRDIALSKGGRWHIAGVNDNTNHICLVTETSKRRVDQAAKIDIAGENDEIVQMPDGFSEPIGIVYNPKLDEVYIPYDNHSIMHLIDYKKKGEISEISIPAYGNDASVLDIKDDKMYIDSWAHAEVEVINLKTRKFKKKIESLGIIPHMFAMTFNSNNGMIYFPVGASAVNGTFGAALTMLDPATGFRKKIHTGWAPIDMIEVPSRNSFLVFNNEDRFAEVKYDGSARFYSLPHDYPVQALNGPDESIYLTYGPHQSYWPTVYIWGAKNGVLKINTEIDPEDRRGYIAMSEEQLEGFTESEYYDRRIPRQPLKSVVDKNGKLYMAQNNWGREPQFLNVLKDGVRNMEIGERIKLDDTVQRETTQRLLSYDEKLNKLYLCRVAEDDTSNGILQIIDLDSGKVERRIETGRGPVDMIFDEDNIYVANAESNNIAIIPKDDYSISEIGTGDYPFIAILTGDYPIRMCLCNDIPYFINHLGNSISRIGRSGPAVDIPYAGFPDNIICRGDKIIISSFNENELNIIEFDPVRESFRLVFTNKYPYGDTRMDSGNSAFYLNGQFGDAVFALTKMILSKDGKIWVSDFLSGKVFIID